MGKKDITLKDYFSDSTRYADLLNGSVFQGKQMICAGELQDADTAQAKSDALAVLERTNDIAMKQMKDGSIFAVWVVANQEKVDYSMPARVMMQEALAYDKQLKEMKRENKDKEQENPFADSGEFLSKIRKWDRLYPVVTLVVYWGEEQWQGAKSLHDMIRFGEDKALADALRKLIPEYPLHFLNLSEVHDYRKFHSEIRTLFELYDKRNDKEAFYSYLNHNDRGRKMDEETAWALSKMLNMDVTKLQRNENQEEGGESGMMCKAIEDLIEDGRAEGKAEGRLSTLYELAQDGLLSIKDAAIKASMPEDVFSAEMEKAGYCK